ncbi:MAG TPA: hypothetical protein VEY92_13150 [Pseudoxanthomonas sp.]|nr:hypothetical protein [Pseudoxanthomonas sp.]
MQLLDFLGALACIVAGGVVGAAFGYGYGRRVGIRFQRTLAIRRRRPVNMNIDYNFAVAALNNCGYKVVRAQERLH